MSVSITRACAIVESRLNQIATATELHIIYTDYTKNTNNRFQLFNDRAHIAVTPGADEARRED